VEIELPVSDQIEDVDPILQLEIDGGLVLHGSPFGRASYRVRMARLQDYIQVLHTGDAVRRYAELDERRTAAALHLTCWAASDVSERFGRIVYQALALVSER
jgi:hypothetical protein